jgi:hypothetical protein
MEENIDIKRLRILLQKYGQEVVNEMRNRVPVDTGALKNSIDYRIEEQEDSLSIVFKMLGYGNFVDRGVNGLRRKYGSPFSFKYTRTLNQVPKSQRSKWGYGTPPTHFATISVKRREKQMLKDIEDLMIGELRKSLEDYIKKNLK